LNDSENAECFPDGLGDAHVGHLGRSSPGHAIAHVVRGFVDVAVERELNRDRRRLFADDER